jgi:hypothetical protein
MYFTVLDIANRLCVLQIRGVPRREGRVLLENSVRPKEEEEVEVVAAVVLSGVKVVVVINFHLKQFSLWSFFRL